MENPEGFRLALMGMFAGGAIGSFIGLAYILYCYFTDGKKK